MLVCHLSRAEAAFIYPAPGTQKKHWFHVVSVSSTPASSSPSSPCSMTSWLPNMACGLWAGLPFLVSSSFWTARLDSCVFHSTPCSFLSTYFCSCYSFHLFKHCPSSRPTSHLAFTSCSHPRCFHVLWHSLSMALYRSLALSGNHFMYLSPVSPAETRDNIGGGVVGNIRWPLRPWLNLSHIRPLSQG